MTKLASAAPASSRVSAESAKRPVSTSTATITSMPTQMPADRMCTTSTSCRVRRGSVRRAGERSGLRVTVGVAMCASLLSLARKGIRSLATVGVRTRSYGSADAVRSAGGHSAARSLGLIPQPAAPQSTSPDW